jgi:hypothetical protein
VRENLIRLTWKDDRICAMLGIEFHPDHAGFGETVPEALLDLAAKIEKQVESPIGHFRIGTLTSDHSQQHTSRTFVLLA